MEWQKDVDSMITDLMVIKTRITQIDSVVSDKQFMVDRLKAILNDKKTRLESTKSNLINMPLVKSEDEKDKKRKDAKIKHTKGVINDQMIRIQHKEKKINDDLSSIKQLTWDTAYSLRSCIFNLDIYNPEDDNQQLSNSEESVPLLGYSSAGSILSQTSSSTTGHHATDTSFDTILGSSSASNVLASEPKFTIIEPWISGSLDIKPYINWGSCS